MSEITKILDDSSASSDVKEQALALALKIAAPIAYDSAKTAAGGEFLAILLELLKVLLPILLQLLAGGL